MLGGAVSLALLAGSSSHTPAIAHESTSRKIVLILQSEDEAAFDETVSGLSQHFQKVHSDKAVRIEVRNLARLVSPESELKAELEALKPALLITLGSQATLWAQSSVRDVPLLFGMVLDPLAQGIEPAHASSPMTGVSMQIPFSEQFERLRQVLPGARRVGTVFDARNQALIDEARREAGRQGLTLVGAPVANPAEVPEAFRTLVGKVDALWSFPDTTVYSREAAQFILLFSFRNRLPLMGFSRGYVRAGALFALYADYRDLGRQLAGVAHEIIGGRSPRDIPMAAPRRHALAINLRVAEALGTSVPAGVRAQAEELFK